MAEKGCPANSVEPASLPPPSCCLYVSMFSQVRGSACSAWGNLARTALPRSAVSHLWDHKLTSECILLGFCSALFHWSLCSHPVLSCLQLLYGTCLKAQTVSSEACTSLLSEMASLPFGLHRCRGLLLLCLGFDPGIASFGRLLLVCRAQCMAQGCSLSFTQPIGDTSSAVQTEANCTTEVLLLKGLNTINFNTYELHL